MIKNCYFKCILCGNVITKYIDEAYQDEAIKHLECDNCGSHSFEKTTGETTTNIKIKQRVRDNKSIDKERYLSQEYKDIRANINRVHKEKKGVVGEYGRKFI